MLCHTAGRPTPEIPLRTVRCLWQLLPMAAVAVGALLGAGGCRQSRLAEQRVALRGEHLARTVDTAVKHERSRPRRLARTLNQIHWQVRRDAEASRANVDGMKRYWRSEWRRWLQRRPAYRDEASRVLLGKPDRIECNAIILFF
ncbi:MAG: hypothetical protein ACE5I3_08365 [Phycisphaerae bacterium]